MACPPRKHASRKQARRGVAPDGVPGPPFTSPLTGLACDQQHPYGFTVRRSAAAGRILRQWRRELRARAPAENWLSRAAQPEAVWAEVPDQAQPRRRRAAVERA